MLPGDPLQVRRREHGALLQLAQTVLQADQRVVAAWLFGSVGCRTADVFSDLDVWVIIKDEYIETMSAERQSYAAQLDQPVHLLASPGNAPTGGAYLLALYPGRAGMHQVDWYWQRQSDASLPRHAVLLLNRAGIP
jgi:predicted nucleotidyltransferase